MPLPPLPNLTPPQSFPSAGAPVPFNPLGQPINLGPGGFPPRLAYFNRSGRFYLDGNEGIAIYQFFDGLHYVDGLSFSAFGSFPTQFGLQNGFLYSSTTGQFFYLFGITPFFQPGLGANSFLMFMSLDGVNFFGYENTTGGTLRSTSLGQ